MTKYMGIFVIRISDEGIHLTFGIIDIICINQEFFEEIIAEMSSIRKFLGIFSWDKKSSYSVL